MKTTERIAWVAAGAALSLLIRERREDPVAGILRRSFAVKNARVCKNEGAAPGIEP
jgi:hypothetical protein